MQTVGDANWNAWDPFRLFDEDLTAAKYGAMQRGDSLLRERRFALANPIYDQALAEARSKFDTAYEACVMVHCAEAHRLQGQWRDAIQDYGSALQSNALAGHRHDMAIIHWMMGLCVQAEETYGRAMQIFLSAHEQFKQLYEDNLSLSRASRAGYYRALAEAMLMLHNQAEALARGAEERHQAAEADRRRWSAAEEEKRRLRQTIAELEASLKQAERRQQTAQEKIGQLNLEREVVERQAASKEQTWEYARAALEKQIAALNQELDAVRQQNASMQTQAAELDSRYTREQHWRQTAEKEMQEWQTRAGDLQKRLTAEEQEKRQREAAIEDVRKQLTAEEQRRQEAERARQEWQAAAEDAAKKLGETEQRQQALEKDKQQWQTVATDYQKRAADSEQQAQSAARSFQKQLADLEQQIQSAAKDFQEQLAETVRQREEAEEDKRKWRAVAEEFRRQFAEDADHPVKLRPKVISWIETTLTDMGYNQAGIDRMTAEQIIHVLELRNPDPEHPAKPPHPLLGQDLPESFLEAIPVYRKSLAAGQGIWLSDDDEIEGHITTVGALFSGKQYHVVQIGCDDEKFRLKQGFQYGATQVTGDSMELANIEDGDYVILQKPIGLPYKPDDHDVAAAAIEDGLDRYGTVKLVRIDEVGLLRLEPESRNRKHQPRTFDLNEPDKLPEFIGKVVAVLKEVAEVQ